VSASGSNNIDVGESDSFGVKHPWPRTGSPAQKRAGQRCV